jgi:hypothetical protein
MQNVNLCSCARIFLKIFDLYLRKSAQISVLIKIRQCPVIDISSGGYADYSLDMLVKLGRRYPNARVFGIDHMSDIGFAVRYLAFTRRCCII